jgi:hypothetical protein
MDGSSLWADRGREDWSDDSAAAGRSCQSWLPDWRPAGPGAGTGVTLGGWNPDTTTLQDWVLSTINHAHPFLRAPDFGPDVRRTKRSFVCVAPSVAPGRT